MGDEGKRNRWIKSLDEAGFLDEIEDEWILEYTGPIENATIVVERKKSSGDREDDTQPAESTTKSSKGKAPQKEERPFVVPISSSPPPPPPPPPIQRNVVPGAPVQISATTLPPYFESDLRTSDLDELDAPDPDELTPGDIVDRPPTFDSPSSNESATPVARRTIRGMNPFEIGQPEGDQAAPTSPPPVTNAQDDHAAMRRSFDLGDYSGSLDLAKKILAQDKADEEARQIADACERTLIQMYESRIGSFDHVPVHAIPTEEIIWRNLDAGAGFVLSRIDGMVSFEDILDISGLSRFETCRILNQLLQDGIIK